MSNFDIIKTVINAGLKVQLFGDGVVRVDYLYDLNWGNNDDPYWDHLHDRHLYLSGKKTSDQRRFKKLVKKLGMRW